MSGLSITGIVVVCLVVLLGIALGPDLIRYIRISRM
jgi:hypothetical protein